MGATGSLDDSVIREIAKALILAPGIMESDERYQRIKEQAPEDFSAIRAYVHLLVVTEECAAFGGIEKLGDDSYEWVLRNVDDISFDFKKHVLERGIREKKISLIRRALDRLDEIELSQHALSIEALMHRIKSGDYDKQLKKMAEIIRDRANGASDLTVESWRDATKRNI